MDNYLQFLDNLEFYSKDIIELNGSWSQLSSELRERWVAWKLHTMSPKMLRFALDNGELLLTYDTVPIEMYRFNGEILGSATLRFRMESLLPYQLRHPYINILGVILGVDIVKEISVYDNDLSELLWRLVTEVTPQVAFEALYILHHRADWK